MINLEKMIERFKNMFVVLIYVPYLIAVILSLPIVVFIYPKKVKRYGTQIQEIRWRDK